MDEAILRTENPSYNAITENLEDHGKMDTSFAHEVKLISKASVPLVTTFLLQAMVPIITMYSVGKLGPKELASASLALASFSITALAFYQGMATSLDSLCSQAYGAKKYHLVGIYFQRCSLIMLLVTAIVVAPIMWFSGAILNFFIHDEELATLCQTFLRYAILACPGYLFFETGKRFLQAQSIFNAGTYALCVAVPIHFVLSWILVYHPKYALGYIGAPISLAVAYWIMPLLLLPYAVFIDGSKCWAGLDLQKALINWKAIWRLALPGVIMVLAEFLAFEILTIIAAPFGTTALAAQSIGSNMSTLLFQIPFAVSVGISTHIGHAVGVADIKAARTISKVSFFFGLCISCFNFLVLAIGRGKLAKVFTEDKDVIKLATSLLLLVAINQICDVMNVVGAGILRGQGRQKIGSILNLCCYYLIALPLAIMLGVHTKLRLHGLWLGIISGVASLAIAEFTCVFRTNWSKVVVEAAKNHDH